MTILPFLADAPNDAAGVFFGLGAFGLALALIASLFWLWMLIDALTSTTLPPPMKLVWAALIFFLPFVGAVAYFFAGRKART